MCETNEPNLEFPNLSAPPIINGMKRIVVKTTTYKSRLAKRGKQVKQSFTLLIFLQRKVFG